MFAVFRQHEGEIATEINDKGLKSDDVLAVLGSDLAGRLLTQLRWRERRRGGGSQGHADRPDYTSWLGADKVWLPEEEAGRVGAMHVVGSTRPECGGEIEHTGCLRPYEVIVLR